MSGQETGREKRYIGSTKLAARYDRAVRTIMRWVKDPPPGFPLPEKIFGRNMWDLDAVEAYERASAETRRSTTTEAA